MVFLSRPPGHLPGHLPIPSFHKKVFGKVLDAEGSAFAGAPARRKRLWQAGPRAGRPKVSPTRPSVSEPAEGGYVSLLPTGWVPEEASSVPRF